MRLLKVSSRCPAAFRGEMALPWVAPKHEIISSETHFSTNNGCFIHELNWKFITMDFWRNHVILALNVVAKFIIMSYVPLTSPKNKSELLTTSVVSPLVRMSKTDILRYLKKRRDSWIISSVIKCCLNDSLCLWKVHINNKVLKSCVT